MDYANNLQVAIIVLSVTLFIMSWDYATPIYKKIKSLSTNKPLTTNDNLKLKTGIFQSKNSSRCSRYNEAFHSILQTGIKCPTIIPILSPKHGLFQKNIH